LLEPNDIQLFLRFIKQGETIKFIDQYENLKKEFSGGKKILVYQNENEPINYKNLEKL
jgi:hypothetical protein